MFIRAYDLFTLFSCIVIFGNLAILVYEAVAYLLEWESYFDRKQALWTFLGAAFGLTYLNYGFLKIVAMQEQTEMKTMLMRAFDLFALFSFIVIFGNLEILVYETIAYLLEWESHFDWKQALLIVVGLSFGFGFLCEAIVKIVKMQKQTEKNAMLVLAFDLFIHFLGIIIMGNLAILVYETMAYLLEWESHFDWKQALLIVVGLSFLCGTIGNKISLMEQEQKRKNAP